MTPLLRDDFIARIISDNPPALTTYRLGEGCLGFTDEALKILRGFGSGSAWNELESAIFRQEPGTVIHIRKGEQTGHVIADEAVKQELRKIGSHAAWCAFRSYVEVAPLREQGPEIHY